MKTRSIVAGLALSAGMAASANAAFTGFTVESMGVIGGRDVYRVFANFNAPTDIALNVLSHQVTAGTMNALHNDNDVLDDGPGTWSPSFTIGAAQRANDSYVTITGLTGSSALTNLDPSFGAGQGASIPFKGGWFHGANPPGVTVGATGKLLLMQVALAVGDAGYSASMQVGYKVSASATDPVFGSGSYTIPAPGAIALLGVAGLIGRRRRA